MTWNKSKDIFALMVGHGKSLDGSWDPGCTYGKYTEADLMLNIVTVAAKFLRRSGVRVITDADKANNRNMKSCVAWANKGKAKYYMSVHCDYSKATKGVAPLYKTSSEKTMAETIGKSVAKQMGMKWKGAFKRTDLYELNATSMRSVIFEAGAIKADLAYLKSYKKYGKALAKAICKYIGVSFIEHSNAYNIRKRAKSMHLEMKKLGFRYLGSGNAMSWPGAKKKKTSNCATYVCYILQTLGLLKPGQVFYGNKHKLNFRGKGTEAQLKKVATIKKNFKAPRKSDLKKGDICTYSDPAHTQIFAGWKNGNALWYSYGPTDVKAKLPRKRGNYNKKTIEYIIRLK